MRLQAAGFLAISLLAAPLPAQQAGSPANTVGVIRAVADMLGAVGDALGKLTDGVQKMVSAGDRGWTVVQARRTHESLLELSHLTTGLAVGQKYGPLPALDKYLKNPTPENWTAASERIGKILVVVDSILRRLDTERSDLVLQPVYAKLTEALHGRQALLKPLQSAPPPRTPAELGELRRLVARYRIMIAQLESARDELNAYASEPQPPST